MQCIHTSDFYCSVTSVCLVTSFITFCSGFQYGKKYLFLPSTAENDISDTCRYADVKTVTLKGLQKVGDMWGTPSPLLAK